MNNNKLLSFSLKLPIFCTVLLIISKFFVYKNTRSLSIFSSFADSAFDFIASFISLIALNYATKEKDEDHKYGYYGVIDLATVSIASFILLTSFLIFHKSIINIINKNIIEYNTSSTYVMLFSIFLSGILTVFLNFVYKKTNSVLVKNEIAHYNSDILTSIGILVSLLICKFYNNFLIDPIIAMAMACISLKLAIEILKSAINNILSKEIDKDTRNEIIKIVTSYKEVIGYHKFKTRKSGEVVFIQIDIELPSNLSFKETHNIVQKIENNIKEKINNSDVIIHADPK